MSTPSSSPQLPVMQSEKAINYCRLYIEHGCKRYGIRYTTPTEELVEMFSRQPLSVRDFLKYTRAKELEDAFRECLWSIDVDPGPPSEPKVEKVDESLPLGCLEKSWLGLGDGPKRGRLR